MDEKVAFETRLSCFWTPFLHQYALWTYGSKDIFSEVLLYFKKPVQFCLHIWLF